MRLLADPVIAHFLAGWDLELLLGTIGQAHCEQGKAWCPLSQGHAAAERSTCWSSVEEPDH